MPNFFVVVAEIAFIHAGTKYIKRQWDFDNFLKFRHTLLSILQQGNTCDKPWSVFSSWGILYCSTDTPSVLLCSGEWAVGPWGPILPEYVLTKERNDQSIKLPTKKIETARTHIGDTSILYFMLSAKKESTKKDTKIIACSLWPHSVMVNFDFAKIQVSHEFSGR